MIGAIITGVSRFAPIFIRAGSKYFVKTGVSSTFSKSVKLGSLNLSKTYGKMSPLAKRTLNNLGGNIGATVVLDSYKSFSTVRNSFKVKSRKLSQMPYTRYGRYYSRYPRFTRRFNRFRRYSNYRRRY